MSNRSLMAMGALVGLMATAAARADFATIDAEPYAPGTDVSNVFDGVTLSHISWVNGGFQPSPVYSAGCTAGTDPVCNALGLASFGWLTPTGTVNRSWSSYSIPTVQICLTDPGHSYCGSSSPPQHLLELSFDADTDFVQFNATYWNDFADVLAFDAAGNVITVTEQRTSIQNHANGFTYGHERWNISSTLGNIRKLWIAGGGGYVSINRISFNRTAPTCPIEEPSQ